MRVFSVLVLCLTLLVNINRLRKKAQEIGIEDLLENVRGKGYKL